MAFVPLLNHQSMHSITALIVTYNRLEKLKKTLNNTLLQDHLESILVINNASTDGTKEWLDSLDNPKISIIHMQSNLGGAGGFSKGLKSASAYTQAEWIVLYDDDAYPSKEAFKQFINSTKNNRFDAAAAAVYYPSQAICEMNRPSWNPFSSNKLLFKTLFSLIQSKNKRIAFHVKDENYIQKKPIKIDSSSFVGFFIKRTILKQLPQIDPRLFIYSDDIIYTLNITNKGYQHLFLPSVVFIHDCETIRHKTYFPLWKNYFHFRNSLILYKKCSNYFFIFVFLLKSFQWITQVRFHENKFLFIKLWLQAVKDGYTNNLSALPRDIITKYSNKN